MNQMDQFNRSQKEQSRVCSVPSSYDYSDFVGLRPKMNEDGSMGFDCKTVYLALQMEAQTETEILKPIDVRRERNIF